MICRYVIHAEARLDDTRAATTPDLDRHRAIKVINGGVDIDSLMALITEVRAESAYPEVAAVVRKQAAALAAVETVAAEYEAISRNRRLSGAHRSTCLGVAQRIRAALAAGDDGQAAHPCPDCGCMCSAAEAMCWRCGAVQPEEGQS